MKADLHCHSVYSDGSVSVPELLRYAFIFGLDCIALTDHDTMDGVVQAVEYGEKYGVLVIPGAECSCFDKERNRPVHILCYNPKDKASFEAEIAKTLRKRRKQKLAVIEKLSNIYPIALSDIAPYLKDSACIYECHIIQALADMGYTNTVCGELMNSLLKKGGSCYVPTDYSDVREICKVINECGGTAVIAHPEQYDSIELTRELSQKNLISGVEVYHPRNSENTRKKLLDIAGEYELLVTGGSDFHGRFTENPHTLGFCTADEESVLRLLSKAFLWEREV